VRINDPGLDYVESNNDYGDTMRSVTLPQLYDTFEFSQQKKFSSCRPYKTRRFFSYYKSSRVGRIQFPSSSFQAQTG
jgi:hypothetical protein